MAGSTPDEIGSEELRPIARKDRTNRTRDAGFGGNPQGDKALAESTRRR
jgi:hypothetical protein